MTVRKYTYLHFTPKLPHASGGSRQEQLAAQVEFAWSHLSAALREGRPAVVKAAGQFLVDSQALLSRWLSLSTRNGEDQMPAEDQIPKDKCLMGKAEYFAMMHLVQTDPDLAKRWEDLVEKTRAQFQP
jgi:hypothetical protein